MRTILREKLNGFPARLRSVRFCFLTLGILTLLFLLLHIAKDEADTKRLQFLQYSLQTMDDQLNASVCRFLRSSLALSDYPCDLGEFFWPEKSDVETEQLTKAEALQKYQFRLINLMRIQGDPGRLLLFRASDSTIVTTFSDNLPYDETHPANVYLTDPHVLEDLFSTRFIRMDDGELIYYCPKYPVRTINNLTDCAILIIEKPAKLFDTDIHGFCPGGTLTVLCDGEVVHTAGENTLSAEALNLALSAKSSTNSFFTCKDMSLKSYRFLSVPSSCSNLQYLYYEPVYISWGVNGLSSLFPLSCCFILLFLCILLGRESLRAGAGRQTQTVPYPGAEQQTQAAPYPGVGRQTQAAPYPGAVRQEQAAPYPGAETQGYPVDSTPAVFQYTYFSACAIVYQTAPGCLQDTDEQQRILTTCGHFLEENGICYRLEVESACVICHFNYEKHDIQALCCSLLERLASVHKTIVFNIYISAPCSDVREISTELTFLRDIMKYGSVWGFGNCLSSAYLKKCRTDELPGCGELLMTLRENLSKKNYMGAAACLAEKQGFITDWIAGKETADPRHMYHFICDAFFTVRLFFEEKGYSCPSMPDTADELLLKSDGIGGALKALSSAISTYAKENAFTPGTYEQDIIQVLLAYIEQNLAAVTLSSAAEHIHVSSAHLSRLFKKNMGQTFSEYVSAQKMKKASYLLVESSFSVAEISALLGYSTPSYFLSRFKEAFGTTPSAYRKASLTQDSSAQNTT